MGPVALVTGAGSGVGLALVEALSRRPGIEQVFATTRAPHVSGRLADVATDNPRIRTLTLDVTDTASLGAAAAQLFENSAHGAIDLVINTAGILHDGSNMPEKRLAEADIDWLRRSFDVNAAGVLLLARALEPLLRASRGAWFASLSARVGSIGDNRLGGWYAYRASKAAQNMIIRTLSIEWARQRPAINCVALHPGTVDTELSRPFLGGNAQREVFSPARSAAMLLDVIAGLQPEQTGSFLAWDGNAIDW